MHLVDGEKLETLIRKVGVLLIYEASLPHLRKERIKQEFLILKLHLKSTPQTVQRERLCEEPFTIY